MNEEDKMPDDDETEKGGESDEGGDSGKSLKDYLKDMRPSDPVFFRAEPDPNSVLSLLDELKIERSEDEGQ